MSSNSDNKIGFLLLSVKIGKGFWLTLGDEEIWIGVNKIKNRNEVSIGIRASKKVKIDRKRPMDPIEK